jgi:hypothetical protein
MLYPVCDGVCMSDHILEFDVSVVVKCFSLLEIRCINLDTEGYHSPTYSFVVARSRKSFFITLATDLQLVVTTVTFGLFYCLSVPPFDIRQNANNFHYAIVY